MMQRLSIARSSRLDVAISIAACAAEQDGPDATEILIIEMGPDGSFGLSRSDIGHVAIGTDMYWLLDATSTIIGCALVLFRYEYIKHDWEWGHFYSSIFGYDPQIPGWQEALEAWEPTGHERMRLAAAIGIISGQSDR